MFSAALERSLFAASLASFVIVGANESVAVENCSIENVKVEISRQWQERDWFNVTYFVSHSCSQAVGVQLRATGYYKDGSIAFSQEMWPGSISNLPPNVEIPKEWLQNVPAPIEKFELVPMEVKIW